MNIRIVKSEEIEKVVSHLFVEANKTLPSSTCNIIKRAESFETNTLAKAVLGMLTENISAAKELNVPVCQDTGMAIVFAEIGQDVHIEGDFNTAINNGVRRAYLDGKLRCSVVSDPLYNRTNTNDNTPAIIYTTIVPGDKIKITAVPKGFGSENMSAIKMFTPSATEDDIVAFVTDTVNHAGANPCPPIVVGVGIGGTFDYAALLSKKALTRNADDENPDKDYARLEKRILNEINGLGIGPQGFGGDTTALAVKIEKYPTHIAGLPVAVNICCHVLRHAEATI